jgi:hypothetical protein
MFNTVSFQRNTRKDITKFITPHTLLGGCLREEGMALDKHDVPFQGKLTEQKYIKANHWDDKTQT